MYSILSRKFAYPLLFRLRNEPVINDLQWLRKKQWDNYNLVVERQINNFKAVANAGLSSYECYRKIVSNSGMSIIDIQSLEDIKRWPMMTKTDLNQAVHEVRKNKNRLPAHTIRLTGGSSGDPCVVLADRLTTSRSFAARSLFQEWHGIQIGDRQLRLWGRPLSKSAWKEHLKDFVLNRIRFDSIALDKNHFSKTIKRISDFGIDYIYGYASLIAFFIDNLDDSAINSLHDTLKVAISTSETMSDVQRQKLQNILGRPVVDEYGCSEIDIISFCCPEGGMHTSAENVLVEVVRFGDEPLGFGQVVVTDLVNTMMPVIRYCVGDIAPLETPACCCGRGWPCLGPILGRVQNQFILLGDESRKVHSQFVVYMIERLFDEGWGIGRFQIVQEKIDTLILYFVPVEGKLCDLKKLHEILQKEGMSVFGSDMKWQIFLVENDYFANHKNKFMHFICKLHQ